MNWVDIKYIFEQIKNGKVVSKKASSLTDEWITLQLTPTTVVGQYNHQGLEQGIYLVSMGWQGGSAMFFHYMGSERADFQPYGSSAGQVSLSLQENSLSAFWVTEGARKPMRNLKMNVKKIL